MTQASAELPEPGLEPRRITFAQYHAHTPEKLEFLSGYLIAPADSAEERRQLLALLLVNVGPIDAVKLAPEARWRESLNRTHGWMTASCSCPSRSSPGSEVPRSRQSSRYSVHNRTTSTGRSSMST